MPKKGDRKSVNVWLPSRYQEMLKALPDLSISDILRKAIEDAFEGRNDREYAFLCVEEDLEDAMAEWRRNLGMESSYTITSTEDGFRIVIVGLKKFDDV